MGSCCGSEKTCSGGAETSENAGVSCVVPAAAAVSHEHSHGGGCCDNDKKGVDYLFWAPLLVILVFYPLQWIKLDGWVSNFSLAIFDIVNSMVWGLLLGVFFVALLSRVPKEFVMSVMGVNRGFGGLLRATGAGLLLDLCSHGILLVGAKLYERGASIGQVMAFLIASPWNSLSLTFILVAFIGVAWTLAFILLSALIAIATGFIFDTLVTRGVLPQNPHTPQMPDNFQFWAEAKQRLKSTELSPSKLKRFVLDGIKESKMLIRWLFIGVVLAALIRAFVPEDVFGSYFGPTLLGLGLTLAAATVIEVCSEGATPIAADIFNRAAAPGNSFSFLMAGVATDYTEVAILKETTRSWKIALAIRGGA